MERCTKCRFAVKLDCPETAYVCGILLRPDPFEPGRDFRRCAGWREKEEKDGKGKAAQHESD